MKFVDVVKIHVQSGDGGNGCTAFRREKYIARGGPNGGDGGNGGNIIFQGITNKTTLIDFAFQPHQHAKNGSAGKGKNLHGKNGEDCIIPVPLGTVVKNLETQEVLLEVLEQKNYLFLQGGHGGKGNTRFKTSTNRAPEYHQEGEQGEEFWIQLELKLMADVGLVGFPNAGKSTLIRAVSHAKPKVADYPFTTLVPQLGVVKTNDFDPFVIADIPGIIEGAHEGVGLGHQFLRHIERTAILLILLDISGFAEHEPWEEYQILLHELQSFAPHLLDKPRTVVLNKIDTVSDTQEVQELEEKLKEVGETTFMISAVTQEGISNVLQHLVIMIHQAKQKLIAETKEQREEDSVSADPMNRG